MQTKEDRDAEKQSHKYILSIFLLLKESIHSFFITSVSFFLFHKTFWIFILRFCWFLRFCFFSSSLFSVFFFMTIRNAVSLILNSTLFPFNSNHIVFNFNSPVGLVDSSIYHNIRMLLLIIEKNKNIYRKFIHFEWMFPTFDHIALMYTSKSKLKKFSAVYYITSPFKNTQEKKKK